MAESAGLRVAVVGATGLLGSELIRVLEDRHFPVQDLVPIATDRSTGEQVEFRGADRPVLTEIPNLAEIDLLFLCAPAAACLDYALPALQSGVPCLDCSGALASQSDVPLLVADLHPSAEALGRPLIAMPTGTAASLSLVLAPFQRAAGLCRVVLTCFAPASRAGRQGVDALSRQVLAIFNQADPPETGVFDRPVAFDCLPVVGELSDAGITTAEQAVVAELRRLLEAPDLPVTATIVQVPAFSGEGISLAFETDRVFSAAEGAALLAEAAGVVLEQKDPRGPTARASLGDSNVHVGRLRVDPSAPAAGLLLWIATDTVRQSAVNAVKIAEARQAAG